MDAHATSSSRIIFSKDTISLEKIVLELAIDDIQASTHIKGLVKKYRGGGPEHLEMWLIKNT